MTVPRTFEKDVLADAEAILNDATERLGGDARIVALEGLACLVGGCSITQFRREFGRVTPTDKAAAPFVARLQTALLSAPLHPALAIAALLHPEATRESCRSSGAYYTDFRLAAFAGGLLGPSHATGDMVLDPACGSGILLVAYVLAASNGDLARSTELVRAAVCGSDLDARALRSARAALTALSTDVSSVSRLATRLRQHDALLVGSSGWADVAPVGFASAIGNPPWEKIKVSRHEYLRTNGHDRHYGADYGASTSMLSGLQDARNRRSAYGLQVAARIPLSSGGELDLYKAFTASALESLKPGGRLCLIVPAGLIRSQGTEALRRHIISTCGGIDVTVLDNRARYFAIDTRFKFLVLQATKGGRKRPIRIGYGYCNGSGIRHSTVAALDRATLATIRPDLTLPEVRTDREWSLLVGMHERGQYMDAPGSSFRASIVREVDMTRDRPNFVNAPGRELLPLVEGRMVAQHRFGAKAYKSGTGRRATWLPLPPGASQVMPQFHCPARFLTESISKLTQRARIGFCDVTGQTNERSIVACRIPPGVVCGNKVPTITFEGDRDFSTSWLFLAVANSFAFDWFARRVLTTTVNYFILRSIPLPRIDLASTVGQRLVDLAARISALDDQHEPLANHELWNLARWRAEVDALIANAWGLSIEDLALLLEDFPLLDRGQPSPTEGRSTVTRDLVLSTAAQVYGRPDAWGRAVSAAKLAGAVPFVPSEYVGTEALDG